MRASKSRRGRGPRRQRKNWKKSGGYFGRPQRNDGLTGYALDPKVYGHDARELFINGAHSDINSPLRMSVPTNDGEWVSPVGRSKQRKVYNIGGLIVTRPADEPYKDIIAPESHPEEVNFKPHNSLEENIQSSRLPAFPVDSHSDEEASQAETEDDDDDCLSFLESLRPKTTTRHQTIRITKQNINKVRRLRRNNSSRAGGSQQQQFGNISANTAAKDYLELNCDIKYEYCHEVAYRFLGKNGQIESNLFFGTKHVNTQMMFAEDFIGEIIMEYGYEVELDITVTLDQSTDNREYFNVATLVIYKINIIGLGTITLTFDPQSNAQPDFSLEKALRLLICNQVKPPQANRQGSGHEYNLRSKQHDRKPRIPYFEPKPREELESTSAINSLPTTPPHIRPVNKKTNLQKTKKREQNASSLTNFFNKITTSPPPSKKQKISENNENEPPSNQRSSRKKGL